MISVILLALLLQGPKDLQVAENKPLQPVVIVPAGTTIPVALTNRLTTKNAKPGDNIYGKTVFPVTIDDKIVIPEGSHVRGKLIEVERPGRVKGKASMTLSFQTLILPSGVTIPIYATLGSAGGAGQREGEATIKGDSTKGDDAAEIGKSTAGPAAIGGIFRGAKGAAIGGAGGAIGGLAGVLLTRGSDVDLGPGTTIEIVLDKALER